MTVTELVNVLRLEVTASLPSSLLLRRPLQSFYLLPLVLLLSDDSDLRKFWLFWAPFLVGVATSLGVYVSLL